MHDSSLKICRHQPGDPLPWQLLLDADGPRAVVRGYLQRGELWLAHGADEGPAPAGAMVLLQTQPGTWEVMNLAVAPDRQRQGIGTRLLRHARVLARQRGARRLEVGTGNSSLGPLAFYQRFGFRIVGVDTGFFARRWKKPQRENGIVLSDMVRLALEVGPALPAPPSSPSSPSPATTFAFGPSADEGFLAERLYEFNAQATGYHDGLEFSATRRDAAGAIVAGISGHTWGGCCHIALLWVHAAQRGQGLGRELVRATEDMARGKGCTVVQLFSHGFQSPGFYEALGYTAQAVVQDNPVGHTDIFFSKVLRP